MSEKSEKKPGRKPKPSIFDEYEATRQAEKLTVFGVDIKIDASLPPDTILIQNGSDPITLQEFKVALDSMEEADADSLREALAELEDLEETGRIITDPPATYTPVSESLLPPKVVPSLPKVAELADIALLPERSPIRANLANQQAEERALGLATTGKILMKVGRAIQAKTGQVWMQVARLRPLDEADPKSPFSVYARLPDGGSEWVGEFEIDLSDEDISIIVEAVVAARAGASAPPEGYRSNVVVNADGDGADLGLIGKEVMVQTAQGPRPVKVRDARPKESDAEQDKRLENELKQADQVVLYAEQGAEIGWNGFFFRVVPGENTLPRPIADQYMASRKQVQKDGALTNKVVPMSEADTMVALSRRGLL